MIALVTYPYRDRETLAVHLVGEEVELTDERPPRRRPLRSPPRTRTSWTTNPSSPCTRSLHPR